MGLKVLAPWAHPVSGIYYFRKVVPQGLRSILGRSEEKHSLHTRDPNDARRRHRLVEAEVADKWARAHVQTITVASAGAVLTDMDAQALASEICREVLCERQAGPGMPKVWERAVLELQQSLPVGNAEHSAKVIFGLPSAAVLRALGAEIKAFLSRKGLDYDSFGQEKLAYATAQAIFRASKLIKRSAEGDHGAGPTPHPAPWLERAKRKFPKLSVDELMTGYAVEAKIAPKSEKRWRGVMNALAKFLKTDDLSSVTEADMIRWKEYRLSSIASAALRRNWAPMHRPNSKPYSFSIERTWFSMSRRMLTRRDRVTSTDRTCWLCSLLTATARYQPMRTSSAKPLASFSSLLFKRTDRAA
jgi:hypothetical protein